MGPATAVAGIAGDEHGEEPVWYLKILLDSVSRLRGLVLGRMPDALQRRWGPFWVIHIRWTIDCAAPPFMSVAIPKHGSRAFKREPEQLLVTDWTVDHAEDQAMKTLRHLIALLAVVSMTIATTATVAAQGDLASTPPAASAKAGTGTLTVHWRVCKEIPVNGDWFGS